MTIKNFIGLFILGSLVFGWFSAIFWFMYYVAKRALDSNRRHYEAVAEFDRVGRGRRPDVDPRPQPAHAASPSSGPVGAHQATALPGGAVGP